MISNVRSHPFTAVKSTTPKKFTQRKIKISSQGLFFNNRELEKKAPNFGEDKVSFFRPFNSAFERESHTMGKQHRAFNKDAGLNPSIYEKSIMNKGSNGRPHSQERRRFARGINSSVSGPVGNVFSDVMPGDVIAGKKALKKSRQLQNNGQVKRIFNGYIKGDLKSTNAKTYDKTTFVPFVDERDHLGQLIDSDVRTELGQSNYIKKLIVFKPRKHHVKIEIRDDIPRRWLERVGLSSDGAAFTSARNNSVVDDAARKGGLLSHDNKQVM